MLPLLWTAAAAAAELSFPNAPSPEWEGCPLVVVEIAMAGDAMMHTPQVRAARQPDGSYDLGGVFDSIAPWIRNADLALVNLETVTSGEADGGYTGFPLFNSPDAILDALDDAGFDVLQTANNHSLDRGWPGLVRTLDAVKARGLLAAGTWRSQEERARPWVSVELSGGLRVAFLASTLWTNDQCLPPEQGWALSVIADRTLELEVAHAREAHDLVVVGVHWGEEYQDLPSPRTVQLAERLVKAGADIVMGTHPHVLQPAEVRLASDRNGAPRDALVLYSLGNLVSNQRTPGRDGGAIARVTVLRCPSTGQTWLSDVRFTPFWVDTRLADGSAAFRVVPTPPLGVGRCDDPDLDERDCAAALRHREHVAAVFSPDRLDWTADRQAEMPIVFDWRFVRGLGGVAQLTGGRGGSHTPAVGER